MSNDDYYQMKMQQRESVHHTLHSVGVSVRALYICKLLLQEGSARVNPASGNLGRACNPCWSASTGIESRSGLASFAGRGYIALPQTHQEMSIESGVYIESTELKPQERVSAGLDRASVLESTGMLSGAAAELEGALSQARATPYEIEFQTRIRLGMTLSDVYLALDQIEKARVLLADEVAFAKKISQIMEATGTPAQKRAATSGYLQVRDRATQLTLLGQMAPEVSVKTWISRGPGALEDLRGRVVLLEFWATWCKPCQEMFPKLNSFHGEHATRGLEIIALTRHYLAYRGTPEAMNEELQLMRATIAGHGVQFHVGVCEDERLQAVYGANGLPTAVIIDRHGVVRYAGPGADDKAFNEALQKCLEYPA